MAKTSIDIPQLRFNKMSTAKYEELKQAGQLVDNEFYITPDVSSSDIPAISSSTNDYVLSNDGNQLNWVQESEYTKNRIDSKLDENVITNCITKIPQDIKLELSEDGTLTLKAGSKVYVPNSINSFNSLIVNSDINLTLSLQANTSYFLFATAGTDGLSINSVYRQTISNTISGSSIPQNGVFYDITNNKITAVTDGVQDSIFLSFPLCTFTTDTNGQITSIDQVFNGFGYIGSTIFALPGIEGFIPDGFNDDGSLNSIKFVTKNVLTKSRGLTGNLSLYIRSNDVSYSSDVYYNKEFNENRDIIDDAYNNYCLSGYLNADASGRIISFYPYKVIKFSNDQEVVHNTGDEEISGVKTFKDEITAPNQLDYTNITNCITKIPQDIKLELTDGTLTLKAGSKIYYPDGLLNDKKHFSNKILSEDYIFSFEGSGSGIAQVLLELSNASQAITRWKVLNEDPVDINYNRVWNITTNKFWTRTLSNGWIETPAEQLGLIGIVTISDGKVISIDHVFNGYGYIDNTVFSLPGIEGLIPNGFNADGSLNNRKFITTDILTTTNGGSTDVRNILLRENSLGHPTNSYYIQKINKNTSTDVGIGNQDYRVIIASVSFSNGRITSFKPKTTFQAVDYNEYYNTVKEVEDKVSLTKDEEISGVKTFNNEITAPNQVDYTQITNCITKIPQDIKLELSEDGTLTKKAGTKFYIPNGFEEDGITRKFDILVLDKDYSGTVSPTSVGTKLQITNPSNLPDFPRILVENCYSGDTPPSGASLMFWYDTANNLVKLTKDGGNNWEPGYSLPYAITTEENQKYVSIDQAFNGFGYIGNTIFALPGVEGLLPNGRNADGSLNNIKWKADSVITFTYGTPFASTFYFGVYDNKQSLAEYECIVTYYDQVKNIIVDTYPDPDVDRYGWSLWGVLTKDSTGRITSFKPKITFQAIDRSDTYWASSAGKPSNKYVDLTLNATGSSYTAPANGWVTFAKRANNANEYNSIHLEDHNCRWDCNATVANMWCSVSLPVKQNEKFIIEYTTSGELQRFRFIYDEGVK